MTIETIPMPTFYALGLSRKDNQLDNIDFDKIETPLKSLFDLHFQNKVHLITPIEACGETRQAKIDCILKTPFYDKTSKHHQYIASIHLSLTFTHLGSQNGKLTCTDIKDLRFLEMPCDENDLGDWKKLNEFANGDDFNHVYEKLINLLNNFPSRMLRLFDVAEIDLFDIVEKAVKDYESKRTAYAFANVLTDQNNEGSSENILLFSLRLSHEQINSSTYQDTALKALSTHFKAKGVSDIQITNITPVAKADLGMALKFTKPIDLDSFI